MNPKHSEYALRHESNGRLARYKQTRRNMLILAWLGVVFVISIAVIAYCALSN